MPLVINKAAESNKNKNGIDAVFLLRTGQSLDITKEYFIKSLKSLLSRQWMMK